MRTVCWGQASDHSQQPESWNEVDVDDSADKAEIRRQVLHDGSFANSPELRLLSGGGAWRKWENCQTLPPGNLKVKVIPQQPAVRTLDDVTIISEATARAFHRLKQEEESEREETICCTASSTPFATAEAAARKLGFQVKTLDCDLAPNAHVHPLQPVYVWEQNEDSAHEKPKVLARLNEELALSTKELQASAVFAKPLAVVQRRGVRLSARTDVVIHPATTTFRATQGQLNRYLQIWELKTTKALQAKRTAAEGQALVQFLAINIVTDRPGWGVPVVLSDLTEASVFQRGTGPHDIIHVQFKNLEEAYAHMQWLLDRSKADNPDLRLDTSLAPPAVGMFTIMEHQAQSETDSMSADDRSFLKECNADNQSILRKEHVFRKQLHLLAANDDRVSASVNAFSQDHQYMPSILDFVPIDFCG